MYSVVISCASGGGNSINTAFSAIGGPTTQPYYHIAAYGTLTQIVGIAIGTTAPTTTTNDQFYVPSIGSNAKDGLQSERLIPSGSYIYAATIQTAVVSNLLFVELW